MYALIALGRLSGCSPQTLAGGNLLSQQVLSDLWW